MRMRKFLSIVFSLMLLISTGCRKTPVVSNLPPGVSQEEISRWYSAVGALKVIGDVTKQTTEAVVTINRQGAFPDGPQYQAVITALGRVAQAGLQAAQYLETVPDTWDQSVAQQIQQHMNQIRSAVEEATNNGLLGIRNDQSKQEYIKLINRITNAANLVFSLIQVVTGEVLKLPQVQISQSIPKWEVNLGKAL